MSKNKQSLIIQIPASKTVVNMGHLEASEVLLDPNTVMISINEEYDPLYPLACGRDPEKVFTAKFTDITAKVEHKNDGKTYHPIDSDTARTMYKFILKNKDKNFITHCAAGVSRSGAVALFIHDQFGHELKNRFWQTSNPNCQVMGRLLFAKHEERKDDL